MLLSLRGPLGAVRPFWSLGRLMHNTCRLFGLEEFFENSQALPPFDPADKKTYGRAWLADELRQKSFSDLHKLWFVLLKELNLLSTQKAEAHRVQQRWFGRHRVYKCRLSMARIKTVLTERLSIHERAVVLVEAKDAGAPPPSEGELLVEMQKRDKLRQLWRKRHFRKRMNHRLGRKSRFF